MTGDWDARVDGELDAIRAAGRWRVTRDLVTTGPVTGELDGRPVVTFASNDYLGLTHHPRVIAAAHAALDRWGVGSGASRLIVGSRPLHAELEVELAAWKGTEAALLFPTGFAANLGVLATLGGPDVTILSDELNHASIVDGARLARADVRVYRHGDLDHLAKLLVDVTAAGGGPVIVVTDSAFSMDGDVVDVAALVDTYVDLLRNRARPFIFTTAPTPADVAAALAAVRVVRSAEGVALVARLRSHVERLRPGHPTPIVPVVLGEEAAALAAADDLLAQGLLVPAIRPPTVPVGSSRLRVALSAAHTGEQVDRLVAALGTLGRSGAGDPA